MTPTRIVKASDRDLLDRLEDLRVLISPLSDAVSGDVKEKARAERIKVRDQILIRMAGRS